MTLKKLQKWSKSYPIRPRDHFKSHVLIDKKDNFKPSYEKNQCPTSIRSLLAWEYARQWLTERDDFIKAHKIKVKHFKNDYESWLEKHKPTANGTLQGFN